MNRSSPNKNHSSPNKKGNSPNNFSNPPNKNVSHQKICPPQKDNITKVKALYSAPVFSVIQSTY
ncbi:hypothetical protein EV282_0967 [Fictibacillus sp. BK138]|nr:hypothetical protein EV282_0967 [Fictibacillus sp. BK138]